MDAHPFPQKSAPQKPVTSSRRFVSQMLAWTLGGLILGSELAAASSIVTATTMTPHRLPVTARPIVHAMPAATLSPVFDQAIVPVAMQENSIKHPLLEGDKDVTAPTFSPAVWQDAPNVFGFLALSPTPNAIALGNSSGVQPVYSKASAHKAALLSTPVPPTFPALDYLQNNSYGSSSSVKVLRSGISQQKTSIQLTVGKAEAIHLSRPISRVSVSNPAVASAVIISPTQIELLGKGVGVANLLLWGDSGSPEHTVLDISVQRDVSVLVNQLKYVDPGIQIAPMAAEDTIILTGEAKTRESAQLAIEMAKAFFGKSANGSSPAGAAGASSPSGGTATNSRTPGSALPGSSPNVINLIKIVGEPSTKLALVQQKLHDIDPGIRLDVVPGPDGSEKVILSGRVPTASLAAKALNMASVFYGKPGLKMVTAQGGTDFARMQISEGNGSASSGSQATTQTGDAAGAANMLQGSVMTDGSGNVISMLEIAQKPQIRCNIKFLELSKTALNALGSSVSGVGGNTKFANWSGRQATAPGRAISTPSAQNPSGADWSNAASRSGGRWNPTSQTFGGNWNEVYQSGVTQVISINNQLMAAIQALQEKSQVRTLAEPTLTMMSGEQGSFLAGGEVPVAFLGGNGQISIQFKQYGIRLNLLPTATDDGKIQMQVAPEVSAVDPSISVQGVPGFITRRMQTSLLVEPGQSFVLAGLFKQEDTNSTSRFPGLGDLPIIGSFFKNQWKSHNSSEMVVIVKPEIMYSETAITGGDTTKKANELGVVTP